jgi:hypothetical protein
VIITRSYPKANRVDSSNYNPAPFWNSKRERERERERREREREREKNEKRRERREEVLTKRDKRNIIFSIYIS